MWYFQPADFVFMNCTSINVFKILHSL